jgi:hypothetical protein
VRRWPYRVLPNLTLGENLDHMSHELVQVAQGHNVGFVVELTTRFHGQSVEKLKCLQDKLMVNFLYGYTPKENYLVKRLQIDSNLAEKLSQEISFEMKHGSLVPSFIGELIITDITADEYQRTMLSVCYQYQQTTVLGEQICPIFINLGRNFESLLPQLMEFFAPT